MGKHAEFIEERGTAGKKGQAGDEDDPDRDFDPDTVMNHQKFDEITFDKS